MLNFSSQILSKIRSFLFVHIFSFIHKLIMTVHGFSLSVHPTIHNQKTIFLADAPCFLLFCKKKSYTRTQSQAPPTLPLQRPATVAGKVNGRVRMVFVFLRILCVMDTSIVQMARTKALSRAPIMVSTFLLK